MKQLIIEIKRKTSAIKALSEFYELQDYKEQSFFEKLLLKEKKYPDIYFHQGSLNTKALDFVENSKFTIVNSKTLKEQITERRTYIKDSKIEVLYPYINTKVEYSKEFKKEFRKLHELQKDVVILLFSAKDIEIGGIDKFLEIVVNLQCKNYKLLFDIPKEQQKSLEEKIEKNNLQNEVIVLDKEYSTDELLVVSDLCLFPTKQKLFLPTVLKAMHFRNVVFVMRENMSSEIIDSFSLILGEDDRSIYFKVDAITNNKKELKKIQKENQKVVKNMTKKSYIKELQQLIAFHLDI